MIRGTVNTHGRRWNVDLLEWVPDTGALAAVIGDVVIGTVKQGTGGASPWLIAPPAAKTTSVAGVLVEYPDELVLDVLGYGGIAVQLDNMTNAVALFEATLDGVTWHPCPLSRLSVSGEVYTNDEAGVSGLYFGNVSGFSQFKVYLSTAESPVTATVTASTAPHTAAVKNQTVTQGPGLNTGTSQQWYVKFGPAAYDASERLSGAQITAPAAYQEISFSGAGGVVYLNVSGTYAGAVLAFTLEFLGTSQPIQGVRLDGGSAETVTGPLTNVARGWKFLIPSFSGAYSTALRITATALASGTLDLSAVSLPAFFDPTPGVEQLRLPITVVSGSTAASGNTTLITPAAGKKLQIHYLSYNPAGATEAAFRFDAAGPLFLRNNIVTAGSIVAKDFGEFKNIQGAADEPLILNLTAAVSTIWNAFYREID